MDANEVRLSRAYESYGKVLDSVGSGLTGFGFTGSWTAAKSLRCHREPAQPGLPGQQNSL